MASSIPKLRLSSSRDIPFDKLVLSQSNVRRVKCGVSIGELADDIVRRTLLQSLNVRPMLDADGQDTGKFEVPAGGRRFRALELLVKTKRMAKTQPVPCVVREGGSAEEDSLAENVMREALHPLDQFRAFKALREQGTSEEEIAARFFVTPSIVKQRLRLASVSETLLEIYAEDGMTLDQLMAFSVSSDHARQEQVWADVAQSYSNQPYNIRRLLTDQAVPVSDRRAQFVGIAAYEEAGGTIMRDLFTVDQGGWMQDVALLDRLVSENLSEAAHEIAKEGWKWIEAAADLPYGHEYGHRRITGTTQPLSEAEQAACDVLMAEFDQLTDEYDGDDDLPEEVDARLGELETAIDGYVHRPAVYDPQEMARAGVFISLAGNGVLRIDRGYVRAEDEPIVDAETGEVADDAGAIGPQQPSVTIGGQAATAEPVEEEDDVIRPLPERLVTELTAERTVALRNALAEAPDAAFIALLHALCRSVFTPHATSGCVEISVRHAFLGNVAPNLGDTVWAQAIQQRHQAWGDVLPDDPGQLWDVLTEMDAGEQMRLLAHCTALSINALYEPANRYNQGHVSAHGVSKRIASADHIARTIGLDMARAGWQPTVANYLGRVTKPRILDAVREGRGEEMVGLIDHLKKGDMAKEAERLLDGSGWLPEPLRLVPTDGGAEQTSEDRPTEYLPAFLTGDADDELVDEELDPEHFAIAAE
ncbi:MAG: ParB N-terminal domain-containing protein [Novosphingobium sp.]|uniref:ParB/RepB/Spo0J family partition protein n=1 Tax=Novosphingobium sp. TaxID=1874826 RepID=UPI001DDBA840|nr:ParB/RepB/Spo0J family partition protein [Novosphingobium sp.]MCB2057746.1 ParB N-terminal domain-containing protein [Novosphingobium sp.]MCP5386063.1 ParB N-terminal domain-containing protein [Novosphingobium sp.]